MKLVLFQQSDAGPKLRGLLTDCGVINISGVVGSSYTPQLVMEGIIDDFEKLRHGRGNREAITQNREVNVKGYFAPLPHRATAVLVYASASEAAAPGNNIEKPR